MKKDEKDPELLEFSKRLRRARIARGMTQEQLSEAANLDIRSLQRFEAGEMNIILTSLVRLRKSLGCKWSDLLPKDE